MHVRLKMKLGALAVAGSTALLELAGSRRPVGRTTGVECMEAHRQAPPSVLDNGRPYLPGRIASRGPPQRGLRLAQPETGPSSRLTAGVVRERLVEVLVLVLRDRLPVDHRRVEQGEQVRVLGGRGTAEAVRGPRHVRAAQPPHAGRAVAGRRVDRVELRPRRRVYAVHAGRRVTVRPGPPRSAY